MSHGAYVEIEALGPQLPHQRAAFWMLKAVAQWAERSGDEPLLLYFDPRQRDFNLEMITHASLLLAARSAYEALVPLAGEHWFVLPGAAPEDPSHARARLILHVDAGEHHELPGEDVEIWTPRGRVIPPSMVETEVRALHTPTGTTGRAAVEWSQYKNRLFALRALASKLGAPAASGRAPVRTWNLIETPDAAL